MIKKNIEEYCEALGLDTIGFARCRKFSELENFFKKRKELGLENEFEEHDIEKRINPNIYMKEGKTIISIAFPYIWDSSNNENGFSKYTKGFDYHRVVKGYLDKVCEYIESLGGKAISLVDSNALPERYIAYLSGIGFIGKNNMIITEKYGSYVFLGEVITDLEIECDSIRTLEEIQKYNKCSKCIKCIEKCPTKSITISRKNPNICTSYITQKKELSKSELKLLKGKIFGCDICQDSCPYNRGIEKSKIELFRALEFMNESVEIYANINNKFFKENISKTSCGWRGKNVLKRNAIIEIANRGEKIEKYKGNSPYIDEYITKVMDKNES